ncbi:MAG: type I restriction enzyme HsdR N-terminal domain-containing protein [Candidatus Kapabacteria bacterium]|nr:type I restriction enzyme HsdR N-terminal domain-containing protein [Ignavibacteriota bacterium]MCW5884122.1 type I restriction enzyme HsdR N-terminal domain-containing protein [Candidatus Kapabacteria bacterium]
MPVPLNINDIDKLPKLNLPEYSFKFREDSFGCAEIYDQFRKRYIKLTPEEWVRQNFAVYLTKYLEYPQSRLKLEKTVKIGNSQKRCDIVYFDKNLGPEIIVECKSADIVIKRSPFAQIAMYNSLLKVKYLIVTNGLTHYIMQIDYLNNKFEILNYIPAYK